MANKGWKTTCPPKRQGQTVKLRYQDSTGNVYRGNFFWDNRENTWLEVTSGPDGIGLYEVDGWKVLGWK